MERCAEEMSKVEHEPCVHILGFYTNAQAASKVVPEVFGGLQFR